MKSKKTDAIVALKNIGAIAAGTVLLSLGTALFIIPFNLVAGGVSGIAIVLSEIVGSEMFSKELLITLITWLLFFVGFFTLGKSFSAKTLISTVIYTVFVPFFSHFASSGAMGGLFDITSSSHSHISVMVAALFGGALVGMGCAITFHGGGSTGGVDIIAFTICKFFKKLRHSYVMFFIDSLIIISGVIVVSDLVVSLLGIMTAFVSALVIDKLFLGESGAFIAQIVSDNYEEINSMIIEKLERTTTIATIEGGYSRKRKKMLILSFATREYAELMNIIRQADEKAFVTIHRAHEINGEGWSK
ncbi:MAG: YitT family protein [Ruminococcaceae bacterium]|nr:YitT family protein [Oscillospiraceae bacterium]